MTTKIAAKKKRSTSVAPKTVPVIVRTYSAGVHFGDLVSRAGKEVVLENAKRLWSWNGAYTINEIATKGVSKNSRVSAPVKRSVLTEAIEVHDCSPEATECLRAVDWTGWPK